MELLLDALLRLRDHLMTIYADLESIEAYSTKGKGYGPPLSHLQDHVRALDSHLSEIAFYVAPFGTLGRATASRNFGPAPLPKTRPLAATKIGRCPSC